MLRSTWLASLTLLHQIHIHYSGLLILTASWLITLQHVLSLTFWWKALLISTLASTLSTMHQKSKKLAVRPHPVLDHSTAMTPRLSTRNPSNSPLRTSTKLTTNQSRWALTPPEMRVIYKAAVSCTRVTCITLAFVRSSTRPFFTCADSEVSHSTSNNDRAAPSCFKTVCSLVC